MASRTERDTELAEQLDVIRAAFDSVNTHLGAIDHSGRLIACNRQWARLLTRSPRVVPACSKGEDFFHACADLAARGQVSAKRVEAAVREVLDGRQALRELECAGEDPLADYIYMVRVTPLMHDGRPGVVIAYQDVSARRQGVERLSRNADLLNKAQELGRLGGWEWEQRTDRLSWTPEVYHIHGLGEDAQPTLANMLAAYPPDARGELEAAMAAARDSGRPWDMTLRFTTAQGHERWVRSVGAARVQNDHTVGLHGIVQDVTERVVAERERADALQRYESLVNALGEIVYEQDLAAGRLQWFGACMETLGYDANELETDPQQWLARVHPEDRQIVRSSEKAAITTGEPFERSYRLRHRCGEYIWVTDHGTVRLDENSRAVCIVGSLRDISPRKKVETELELHRNHLEELVQQRASDLARSNAELEQFASVISHDLQEPLRMVTSFCQLLRQRYAGQLDADADEFIGFAVDGAERMQRLIQDLLMLSRVGRRDAVRRRVQLNVVCQRAIDNLLALIKEADAEVTAEELPELHCDESLVCSLFQNLIQNAIKFRRPGTRPEVHVSAHRGAGGWVFSVADNGIGFKGEYAERIFQVFQRLHPRKDYPGTGIGLAVCRKIVQRHHGHIWAESRPGAGSTFYFTLA